MRWTVLLIVVAGCGERINPNICCVTDEQCASLDIGELQPCGPGQACGADHLCVAAECETSAQCSDAAPVCRLGFCESTCTGDPDCADVAGRTHCLNSACVGCTGNEQCTSASAGICDADEHACRGCELDTECASGVCIEARGTCAVEADILFVSNGTDTGDCTRAAPCRTIAFAYSKVPFGAPRNIIRIETGVALAPTATLAINQPIIIDGTGTLLPKPVSMPWLQLNIGSDVLLEGVVVDGTNLVNDPAITASAQSNLRLGPGGVARGVITSAGTIVIDRGRVETTVVCTSGTLDVTDATLSDGLLKSTDCQTSIRGSRLHNSRNPIVDARGGKFIAENNLFTNGYELSDSLIVRGIVSGSRFRFNTVVNLSGTIEDGVALACDPALDVSSNIFAYRSMHPLGPTAGCLARFSVFDDTATFATPPVDSVLVPFGTIFVNPANDFQPAATSAARGAADPQSTDVLVDLDGRPRPNPAGSRADSGAFEVP